MPKMLANFCWNLMRDSSDVHKRLKCYALLVLFSHFYCIIELITDCCKTFSSFSSYVYMLVKGYNCHDTITIKYYIQPLTM